MKPATSIRSLGFLLVLASTAHAGVVRKQEADQLISTDHTKTYSLPSATDTLVGRASTDTFTNKSISGSTNTLTAIPASTALSGQVPVANGGTALGSTPTNGQLLIGNGTNYSLATLTQGTGITITNGTGTITIASTGGGTATQEFPSGACNSSNTTFTLAFTPTSNAVVHFYLDGTILTQGSGLDYTISSATITLTTACATGQRVYAVYSH